MGINKIYDKLVNNYYNTIFKYCHSKLKNEHNAKDCTQEVFFTLFKKLKTIRITEDIDNWLYKTADYKIKEFKRKNIQNEELTEDLFTNYFDSLEDNLIKSLLNTDDYNLLIDFYILGKSTNELSQELGITKKAVYQRMYRIRNSLIELLKINNNSFIK